MEDEIVEPYYAGWLSLLPPVIAITLALLTKEVISSLLIGILTGTFIYSVGMNSDVLFMGTIESAFDTMANKVDFNILVFCTLLGALVYTISMAGGTRAYGKWATRRIKSRKAALLSTGGLGAFIFIDDYFNCLTVGTVMKPVTDSYKISRAKLAYIIDATARPSASSRLFPAGPPRWEATSGQPGRSPAILPRLFPLSPITSTPCSPSLWWALSA